MSQVTVIRKDFLGIYAVAGGWIIRPLISPTLFKEGDRVKSHHFGGTQYAGVTFIDKPNCNFLKNGDYETWFTTYEADAFFHSKPLRYDPLYKRKNLFRRGTSWAEYLEARLKISQQAADAAAVVYGKHNSAFSEKYK